MTLDHAAQLEEVMAYVDGELPREAADRVRLHIESCDECRALAGDLRDVSARMHAWDVGPAPASWQPRRAGWRVPSRRLMAIAATLTVVVAGGVWLAMQQQSPPSVDVAADASSFRDRRLVATTPAASARAGRGVVGGQAPAEGSRVIRTAQLRIQPTDFDAARQALDRIIADAGGFVGRIVVSGDRGNARVVEATLRIPSSKLDAVLASLRALGHVSGETREGEDVTRQSADLDARLANARTSEARLRQLLEHRTGDLADVLAVERELARVRQAVESMDAERKSLDQRIAYATVDVTLTEERKAEVEIGPTSFSTLLRNAFVDGWTMALGLVLGTVLVAVRLAPILLVLGAVLVPVLRLVRRRSGFFTKTSPARHDG